MILNFTEYGKERITKKQAEGSLYFGNHLFREIFRLHKNILKSEKEDGLSIANKIKKILEDNIEKYIEMRGIPYVEPLKTIYDELHQIKGGTKRKLSINSETKKYLDNHPEIRLYEVKVKERWVIRRALSDEVHNPTYYLFEKDEKEIQKRIERNQNCIHTSNHYTPVRYIHIEVLNMEHLDLKCLDDLVE